MSRRNLIPVLAIVLLFAIPADAKTIKKLEVSEGYVDENTLPGPVVDGTSVRLSVGTFTESFDRDGVFQRRSGFWRGGLKAKLGPEVEPGTILSDLLRTEAESMGFGVGDGGWKIEGDVRALYLDNDLPSTWAMGVLLFYGYLEADVRVTSPGGETASRTFGLHSYTVQGGMNGLKSARDALAMQLIEGAREILVKLNAEYFHAPPSTAIADYLATLREKGTRDRDTLLLAVGLSGSEEAAPVLLDLLSKTEDEGDRYNIVNALAELAPADVVGSLAARYDDEEDDPRWATLKAMAYIGTDEATAVVREKGLNDKEEYFQALSRRILGLPEPEED